MIRAEKFILPGICLVLLSACELDQKAQGSEAEAKCDCAELKQQGAQYLGGEDGGAWLLLSKETGSEDKLYRIREFQEGTCGLAWDGLFLLRNEGFDRAKPYRFIPLSTYEYCSVEQNGRVFRFDFKRKAGT